MSNLDSVRTNINILSEDSGSVTTNGGNTTVKSISLPQISSHKSLKVILGLQRTSGSGGGSISGMATVSASDANPHIAIAECFYINTSSKILQGTTESTSGINIFTGARTLDIVVNGNAGEVWHWDVKVWEVG